MNRGLIFIFAIISLIGCSSNSHSQLSKKEIRDRHPQLVTTDSYQEYYQEWYSVPYRLGGKTKSGIDCSAFTQNALYSLHQLSLPRTTEYQVTEGKQINLANAQQGDLIFFKTGSKVRHVGIYIGNREFMHASTSKGVIISSLNNPYWKKAFWQVRRVL